MTTLNLHHGISNSKLLSSITISLAARFSPEDVRLRNLISLLASSRNEPRFGFVATSIGVLITGGPKRCVVLHPTSHGFGQHLLNTDVDEFVIHVSDNRLLSVSDLRKEFPNTHIEKKWKPFSSKKFPSYFLKTFSAPPKNILSETILIVEYPLDAVDFCTLTTVFPYCSTIVLPSLLKTESASENIRLLTDFIRQYPGFDNVTYPYGDGVTILRKSSL